MFPESLISFSPSAFWLDVFILRIKIHMWSTIYLQEGFCLSRCQLLLWWMPASDSGLKPTNHFYKGGLENYFSVLVYGQKHEFWHSQIWIRLKLYLARMAGSHPLMDKVYISRQTHRSPEIWNLCRFLTKSRRNFLSFSTSDDSFSWCWHNLGWMTNTLAEGIMQSKCHDNCTECIRKKIRQ